MYSLVKTIHSYWAFLVLILLILAVLNAIRGKISGKDFQSTDLRISLFALIFSHIQLLIGFVLYFVSPWFKQWSSMGMEVMKNAESRLYLVEHPLTNVLAIVLITMGWSLQKRQNESAKKFLRVALFYGIGFIFLLSRIPWSTWL